MAALAATLPRRQRWCNGWSETSLHITQKNAYIDDMKHAELESLKARIGAIVRQSDLASDVADIDVEEASDDEGDTFLRVFLKTSKPNRFSWKRIAHLVRQIEDDVAQVDDRFPSVRIAEAA